MPGLTIPTVRGWDPGALGAAASSLQTVIADVDHELSAVRAAMDAAAGTWTGPAAQAAQARVATEIGAGRGVAAALGAARQALASGATDLTATRSHLLTLVADAQAQGLHVSDDGAVSSPTLPPAGSDSQVAARGQRQAALNDAATSMGSAIGQALADVDRSDAGTATALSSVEIPASITTDVEALLERLRTSGNVYSVLGGGAGAAALGLALKKAWTLFGKTKAFGSFLTSTFGQLKNYPGALRFLAGEGEAADAAAFARFAALGADADAALALFRSGQVSGLLARIPGVAGGMRVLGKAFLPLTVVTGALDAVTGGGYDGARGWATRGFGLAGAAGGGALLASSAGLIALGPVGVAVAGGAVLAYGAWSLGNFVYDHWGQISDFAGKAASWTGHQLGAAWNATTDAASWAGHQLDAAASGAVHTVEHVAGDLAHAGKSALDTVSFGLL